MYRLIYFNRSIGYKSTDYKDDNQRIEAEQEAFDHNANVICIVDYYHKAILQKCLDFNMHREKIDHIIFDPKVMELYY
jgi:hypothetical protein